MTIESNQADYDHYGNDLGVDKFYYVTFATAFIHLLIQHYTFGSFCFSFFKKSPYEFYK